MLRRLHARLEYLLPLHLHRNLLVIAVRVMLPHFMIEKVLFIFERFRAADVLDEKMSERGSD